MASPLHSHRQILEGFLTCEPRKPLIVILGPTASGKTAFSISLAHELRQAFGKTAEIVNADSRQFYRGFDIGTAKITPKEQEGITHHLIDVLDPIQNSTISWFKTEAERIISEIYARGHIPILVGGSMLYVSSLVDGLEPLPPADPAIRESLSQEYDVDNGATLYQRLAKIDPETAASFQVQNKVYVVRALEIFESTGKTKSSQKKMNPNSFDLLMFGMRIEKNVLDERIALRTQSMLSGGWIDEVRALKSLGITLGDPAMKSVGYREISEALDHLGLPDIQKLAALIHSATRAYAKRHIKWWKGDSRIHWITPSSEQVQDAAK